MGFDPVPERFISAAPVIGEFEDAWLTPGVLLPLVTAAGRNPHSTSIRVSRFPDELKVERNL